MADKYLNRNATTGRVSEVEGTVTGGTVTQAGDIVALDGTGRLDASVMPVGIGADAASLEAGEALTAGEFVYISNTGTVRKASANVGGFDAMGFVLDNATAGANVLVYFEGRNTALGGLTPGQRVYLSTTAGSYTITPVTAPAGARHQFLGKAITVDSISFEPTDGITLA